MRGEGSAVDAALVEGAGGVDEGPGAWRGFAMDEDGAVEAARGEDDAEFRVRPGNLPDGSLVALEGGRVGVGVARDVVDFDGPVCMEKNSRWKAYNNKKYVRVVIMQKNGPIRPPRSQRKAMPTLPHGCNITIAMRRNTQ